MRRAWVSLFLLSSLLGDYTISDTKGEERELERDSIFPAYLTFGSDVQYALY